MGKVGNLRRLLTVAVFIGIAAVLLGVPLAASANPDVDGFELDGNAAGNGGSDWDALGSPLEFTGFIADPTGGSDTGYGSGQIEGHDRREPVDVERTDGHAGEVRHRQRLRRRLRRGRQPHPLLRAEPRRSTARATPNVGFWFLQNEVGLERRRLVLRHACRRRPPRAERLHERRRRLRASDVYKWQGGALVKVSDNVGECADGKLGTRRRLRRSSTPERSRTSWAGNITAPYFFEGGLNLTALFPQSLPCFSTFLTNTRTSQSESATLKDFALGSIDTCASIKITKQATPSDGTQFGYSTTGGLNPASFSLLAGSSQTYSKLQPGAYSVSETAPGGGWAFDSLSCPTVSGPGTSVQVTGSTVNITLGFVGNVECTYVNKRKPQVKVVKATDPTTDTGKFDLQINGTTHADDVGHGGSTDFRDVDPGQVTVAELAGASTSLADYVSSVSCDSGKGSANGTSHAFSVGVRRQGHVHDHEPAQGQDHRREADEPRRRDAAVLVHVELRGGLPARRRSAEHVCCSRSGHVLRERDGPERLVADLRDVRRRLDPELDRARRRRDREVHLHELEGRQGGRQEDRWSAAPTRSPSRERPRARSP